MAVTEERVRWAECRDGASIAYRVLGEGTFDLVFVSGLISHIEVLLEEPGLERWFNRLGRIGRLVLIDRRGSGLSDSLSGPLSLEDEVHDLEAVLDEIGSDRAVLQAYAAGGPLALAFAALRPERTLALVLYAAMAHMVRDDDVDWTFSPEERAERLAQMVTDWGTGSNLDIMAPSAATDERMRAWLGRLERLSMTPQGLQRMNENMAATDVRPHLPSIRVPTLVLHRTEDQLIDVRHSRYIADHVPGARLIELPGNDSLPMVGDTEALLGEIEEFLTGGRLRGVERAMLTVLFTDVVGATDLAARMGDSRWRDLLAAHDETVRRALRRYGMHEVKTVGDAFLATYDGPPSTALRCARAIVEEVHGVGLEVRIGLHTGECEIIGEDVGGMAVHIAARVAALAGPGEILASGTAYGTVVGSGLSFSWRGEHELKGVPGAWPIFALD